MLESLSQSVTDQLVGRAEGKGLNGKAWRFSATGRGKDTGIRNDQIAPAMASTKGIDDGILWVSSHAAGAKDMCRGEGIDRRELFDQFCAAGRDRDFAAGFGHKTQAFDRHIVKEGMNARDG